MEQVQLIAANAETARKIEGVLTKILTEVHVKGSAITKEFVESILGKGVETNGAHPRSTPEETIEVVSKYYQIGKRSLLGESRIRSVARPRQMLMYLLRTYLRVSLEEVGRLVGDRDHTTVMHAVGKITQLALSDVHIREDILRIKQSL
jgi:chromosomal replication initiator protein